MLNQIELFLESQRVGITATATMRWILTTFPFHPSLEIFGADTDHHILH